MEDAADAAPHGPDVLAMSARPDPSCIRLARDRVAAHLRRFGWPRAAIDDARLVTSELVANAVMHAHTPFALRCRPVGPSSVRIEVEDADAAHVPQLRGVEDGRPGGMGLHVVRELADAWGVDRSGHHKTVWCVVGVHGATR